MNKVLDKFYIDVTKLSVTEKLEVLKLLGIVGFSTTLTSTMIYGSKGFTNIETNNYVRTDVMYKAKGNNISALQREYLITKEELEHLVQIQKYMDFTKSDIDYGMFIHLSDRCYLKVNTKNFVNVDSEILVAGANWDDNLKYHGDSEYHIVRVIDRDGTVLYDRKAIEDFQEEQKLQQKQQEEQELANKKQMTVSQIEELLGHGVSIVKEGDQDEIS